MDWNKCKRILRLESFRLAVGLGLLVVGLARFVSQKRPWNYGRDTWWRTLASTANSGGIGPKKLKWAAPSAQPPHQGGVRIAWDWQDVDGISDGQKTHRAAKTDKSPQATHCFCHCKGPSYLTHHTFFLKKALVNPSFLCGSPSEGWGEFIAGQSGSPKNYPDSSRFQIRKFPAASLNDKNYSYEDIHNIVAVHTLIPWSYS